MRQLNDKIVISNGFKNFHLVMAGAEVNARNILNMYIAGAYPTKATIKWLSSPLIRKFVNVPRFIARGELINDELIRSKWMPEILHFFSLKISNYRYLESISDYLKVLSFKWYSRQAVRDVREAHARGARIYHYRAGFGHKSAQVAKELGMITLCDHSIVHPETLDYMIENGGKLPTEHYKIHLNFFWKSIRSDFKYADAILVNSEFVKSTFVSRGWDPSLVNVIYLGVDTSFLDHIPLIEKNDQNNGDLKLIFAGLFGKRKGADVLIESLLGLDNISWQLDIAGGVSSYIKREYAEFLSDKRVNVLGILARTELAKRMSAADAFIFPTLAEGSARVIFEAMASGCYIITTPNSGSIVENGIHGELVPSGDSIKLSNAITYAAKNNQVTHKIGANNAGLIQEKYLQKFYGDKLCDLYSDLINRYDG